MNYIAIILDNHSQFVYNTFRIENKLFHNMSSITHKSKNLNNVDKKEKEMKKLLKLMEQKND